MPDRPTAIVADKSEAFLMYMSILLNRMDFEVLPVSNGNSLLKMAEAVQPNLIVMGSALHEASGLDVLKTMRAAKSLAEIPVLVADEDQTLEPLFREQGCQDFLPRPIDIEQFHRALENCQIYPSSQRKFMRAPYNRKVSLTWNYQTVECQATTLSEGGVYIRKKVPFPQGCLLDVSIPIDDDRTLALEGEVIYSKQLAEDRFTMPPGMAIRFFMVNEEDARTLNQYITRLLVGDIIEEQDEPVIRG